MRQFRARDGQPITLGVRPADPDLGTLPGVRFEKPEESKMPKAKETATYQNEKGLRIRIRAGDDIPEGYTAASSAETPGDNAPVETTNGDAGENVEVTATTENPGDNVAVETVDAGSAKSGRKS